MTGDYSDEYLRRWTSTAAANFLPSLLPDGALRAVTCQLLARSIRVANAADPKRWGASRLSDAVRLNVGPAEAIHLTGSAIRLMLDRKTVARLGLSQTVARLPHSDSTSYPSVSGSVYVELELESDAYVRDLLLKLEPAHIQHLESAITLGLNGATRKGHDPLLVDQIAAEARTTLPQPSYVTVARPGGGAESEATSGMSEGAASEITQTAYERSPEAREACLAHYGYACTICGFDFAATYGPSAQRLIHVHHLVELAAGVRRTDPIRDLRPVCPNCHLVIHARRPPLTLDEVKGLLGRDG